jgi:acetyl esterase/lipase
MIILATILSGLSLLLSVLFFIQLDIPSEKLPPFGVLAKLIAGALSPIWVVVGVVGAVIGWVYQAFWAIPMGILGTGIMIWFIWSCTRDHKGFDKAFGPDWSDQIPPEQARRMIQKRWTWFLKMKESPETVWERDVPFWTVPDTDRQLLCDIWSRADCNVSGLGIVFIHGGGWTSMDKDMLTRPFFRHLTAQGHTVMDVAYRLSPEVDMFDMIGDIKRAVAWMKNNASKFDVNPNKIALVGSSVGGHLAQLAGYAPQHPDLTPDDLKNVDLSVCGIISSFGPSDLLVEYEYSQVKQRSENRPPYPIGTKLEANQEFLFSGRLDMILGGHLQDIPETYQLFSPITHVHPDCPPTLLIQGDKDMLVPLEITIALYQKLIKSGVPAINVVFSGAEHGFDLLLPQISPPAQSALYDVDRFLALMLRKDK